jgi:hypothetical protein
MLTFNRFPFPKVQNFHIFDLKSIRLILFIAIILIFHLFHELGLNRSEFGKIFKIEPISKFEFASKNSHNAERLK